MGYVLERQQKGEDKWERCNDFLVPVLSYTVRGLTEGKNYAFRVRAENAAGVSEPSRSTLFVKASDAIGKYKNRLPTAKTLALISVPERFLSLSSFTFNNRHIHS